MFRTSLQFALTSTFLVSLIGFETTSDILICFRSAIVPLKDMILMFPIPFLADLILKKSLVIVLVPETTYRTSEKTNAS